MSRSATPSPTTGFVESWLKGMLLVAVLGVCIAPLAGAFGFASSSGGGAGLILYATAFSVGFAAVEFGIVHYQAHRRFVRAGGLRVIRALALLCAAFVITFTSGGVAAISWLFIASVVAAALVATVPIVLKTAAQPTTSIRPSWLAREEIWLSLYYFASGSFAYVDVMVAGALLDRHDVASLGAALRYVAIVLAAVPALGAVLRVRTSQADLVDSPASQRAMVVGWARKTALPAAILVGAATLLAPTVIPVIDKGRYPTSIEVFQILLVTAFAAYVMAPAANMLMAQRKYAALTAIFIAALVANLAGDIAVARTFGVVGIAIVSASVYVAVEITMFFLAVTYASRKMAAEPA